MHPMFLELKAIVEKYGMADVLTELWNYNSDDVCKWADDPTILDGIIAEAGTKRKTLLTKLMNDYV